MYAIIQTGGKQYRVEPNTILSVEKLEAEPGTEIEIGEVLMVRTDDGIKVGAPYVSGAKVVAEVVRQTKAPKIIGFKIQAQKERAQALGASPAADHPAHQVDRGVSDARTDSARAGRPA
jgi:large subunit ribosomal protein L21